MNKKYIIQVFIMLLIAYSATAQQGINYKAIIKDGSGAAIVNTEVTVQFTILENGTTEVYKETHTPTTDANGIIIVNIGESIDAVGVFNDIDWGSNPHFLKTEIDKGEGLTDMGTTEFKTVPYALHAKTAADAAKKIYVDQLVSRIENLENIVTGLLPDIDSDNDGFTENDGDCNDTDNSIYPGATEICGDGIDQDCDGNDLPCYVENMQILPPIHPINTDISLSPIDLNSNIILDNIDRNTRLMIDFNMPFEVVNSNQPIVPITYTLYVDESDPGPMPIPLDAQIEGNGVGDSHVLTVDIENSMLYELYQAKQIGEGWEAGSGAIFDLSKVEYRPLGFVSADAGGLPIFPLLVRYDEIQKGVIDHAIRFSLDPNKIYNGFVRPANHQILAGGKESNLLPFGARLRLKADFNISGFSETNQIILRAMKKYGIMLSDAGSNMCITGAPHDNWDLDDLGNLRNITVNDFEVIEIGAIISTN